MHLRTFAFLFASIASISHGQTVDGMIVFPSLSPDGRLIVFESDRTGDSEIYVMDREGQRVRRLTFAAGRDGHPAFSPDGSRIAFQSARAGKTPREYEIYVMNADGSDQRAVTSDGGFSGVPSWSPDGARLIYQLKKSANGEAWDSTRWRICVTSVAGSTKRYLTDGSANDQIPDWSPDGLSILFVSDRTGNNEIFELSERTGQTRQITDHPSDDIAAAWSPDGTMISFQSDRSGEHAVYIARRDGTALRRVTLSPTAMGIPFWTQDGAFVLTTQRSDSTRSVVFQRIVK